MQQAALGLRFPFGMLALLVAAIAPGRSQAAQVVQAEGLETIIVTAQKRSQALEDVPLAVTALTAQEIEANGLSTTADLARAAPNMQFQDVGSVQVFNIRGITLIDIGDANEAPVGLYIDDVYQGTVGGHSAALYDLDRVEILRGPQGTLYGRNTTGGLVHLISRRPEQERDGHARLETDSFSRRAVEAAVGGGLGTRAAIRVSGLLDQDDGFQRNVVRGTDFGVTDRWALRLQLALTLAPDWDALLRVHGSESDGIAPGYGFYGKRDPGTNQPCSVSDIFASRCVDPRGFRVAAPEPGTTFSDRDAAASTALASGAFAARPNAARCSALWWGRDVLQRRSFLF